jgi:hypothetical protein
MSFVPRAMRSAMTDAEIATRAEKIPRAALDPKHTIRPSIVSSSGVRTDSLPVLEVARAPGDSGPDLEVQSKLGEGGMGVVELAIQRSLRREVAIKRLHAGGGDPVYVEALLREARHQGQLEHPSIVPVHAIGRDQAGSPVMVMKRVVGARWRELIEDAAHPAWSDVRGAHLDHHVRLAIQICHALELAHEREILHRDVKPDNVLVGAHGEVVLLDWGLAISFDEARARPDELAGTTAYMAPEMVSPTLGELGPHTDVYLLAASLHHALTGAPPHKGDVPVARIASIVLAKPFDYAPNVPAELASILRRAMSRAPADRHPNVAALRCALEDYLAHRGSSEIAEAAAAPIESMNDALARGDRALARAHYDAARFALARAIELWPEHPTASATLVRATARLVESYLAAKQIDLARLLLDDLRARDQSAAAPLDRELERVERVIAKEHEDAARVRAELDPAVSARQRHNALRAIGVFAVVTAGGVFVARLLGVDEIPEWALGALSILVAVLFIGATIVFRRHFFKNQINRTITNLLGGLFALVFVHRVHGLMHGVDVDTIAAGDLLLASVVAFHAAAILRSMRLVVPGILLGGAGIFANFFTEHAIQALGASSVLSVAFLLVAGARGKTADPPPTDPPS